MNTLSVKKSGVAHSWPVILIKHVFMETGAWQSLILLLMVLMVGPAIAAPAIQGVSGTFNHKSTITITGSGFGTKNTAAPLVWDDSSTGSKPSDNGKWTDAWPTQADSSESYTRYTTPIRNVQLPHNNITRYIAGGHGNVGWTLDVTLFKTYTISSYPQPFFISYYMQVDPAWNFCAGDNNFKLGSHSMSGGPYNEPYWYYEHRNADFTASSTPGIFSPYLPSSAGGSHTWLNRTATNPLGKWVKIEYEALYTNQSNGNIKIWSDGRLGTQYNGATDASSPGSRTDGVGGYARCYGNTANWRYFADVYMDTSRQRVILANNATLANATIKEVQIPSAWSDSSISATVNLGKFQAGQTAYLFVFDSSGVPNSTVLPITVGSSGGAPFGGDWPQKANLRIVN